MQTRHPDIRDWGVDADRRNRPGVPREVEPRKVRAAWWDQPEQQTGDVDPARPTYKPRTPVFGTAQPAQGLSGRIRQAAYKIPEYRTGHWLALLFADRVNAIEWRLGAGRGQAHAEPRYEREAAGARKGKAASLLLPVGSALASLLVVQRFAANRGKRSMRRVERERRMHAEHRGDAMPLGWRMQAPEATIGVVAREERVYQH